MQEGSGPAQEMFFLLFWPAALVLGEELSDSVKKAARFVGECIAISDKLAIPRENGVCLEMILGKLISR